MKERPQEFTIETAREYALKRGKNTRFYYNVIGWSSHLTLVPTTSTPSGKLKDFPRSIIVKAKS